MKSFTEKISNDKMVWKCAVCGFAAVVLVILLAHYNSRHVRNGESLAIRCNLNGCTKEYSKLNSLVCHVHGRHAMFLQCRGPSETGGEPTITTVGDESDHEYDDVVSVDDNNDDVSDDDTSSIHSLYDDDRSPTKNTQDVEGAQLPKFLFKIKEENKLTQKCVQQIASVTKNLLQGAVKRMKRKAVDSLSNAGVNSDCIHGFDDSFSDEVLGYNDIMASNVESFYKREDLNVPFVEPQKHVLGKRRIWRKRGTKKRIIITEEEFYYVPLLQTLEIQLRSKGILSMVLNGPDTTINNNILSDFCDGYLFQNHELFSNDPTALQIILYYDDVNLSNPLTNKVHKITFFYYQLGNIRKEYRSKLDSIHLLAVCKTSYIKRYGLNEIFEPLVKELKLLGSDRGYPFRVLRGHLYLRGAVLALLADTPASQLAGAFKESVGGARRKCRHCMANYETMQECFTEEEFTLRNEHDHEEQLQLIENAPSNFLKEFYSKLFGVNGRSRLEKAPYFKVCDQLPQDVMHVFLEGIIAYELKYLLNFFIKEKGYFTLADLNKQLQAFPYGYTHIKDKPCIIKESDLLRESSSNLGQGAASMWLLIQVLPLILSTLVDTDSEHWECLASLLQIIGISFSLNISQEAILFLKNAIKQHLLLFKRVYPGAPIIPKQHYLVHLPSQLFKFGPLIRSWCMRFEGKHSYFKDLSKKIKNFKNIPFSLAQKNQKIECAKNMTVDGDDDSSPIFGNEITFGKNERLVGTDATDARRLIDRFHLIDSPVDKDATVILCKSIIIKGTKYIPGDNNMLHIGYSGNGLPEFGSLVKIWYVLDTGIFFVVKVKSSVEFTEEINALEIEDPLLPQGLEVTRPDDLPSYSVHHCYKSKGKMYIPFKQHIFDHH